ncbi:PREDICTED: uncharacterized protein LOC106818754 [Priapulus caudatus]|uniref:Uncharacterized protein LOC106818754 n=1 Tax=Priapulus caudatus TaxID=37621 RepID=A0ABM1F388_PRICU|nr:PREDICTED: uncharacterized protein LOC106818754 [Priapulus caudatus]
MACQGNKLWSQRSFSDESATKVIAIAQDLGFPAPETRSGSPCKRTDDATHPTTELLTILEALSANRLRLRMLAADNEKRRVDRATSDLTRVDLQEQRVADVQELCCHLEAAIARSADVVERLRSPCVAPHVNVHRSEQRDVCRLLPLVADVIADLDGSGGGEHDVVGLQADAGDIVQAFDGLEPDVGAAYARMRSSLLSVLRLRDIIEQECKGQGAGDENL